MADLINVGKNAMNVTKSDIHIPYSKVVVICEETQTDGTIEQMTYSHGDDTGLTLEVNCPWGTQAMADNLYNQIKNKQYKPFTVTSALLNPAAEIGDAVNTNAVFGGLYAQESTFGHGFYSDYSSPEDEQMNHEYKYETQTERRITREENNTQALFRATSGKIEAKVSKTGGQASSFGWELLDSYFSIKSNNTEVFRCDVNGLTVNGGGTFSGNLSAAGGTFKGELSAATGTFAGNLSAAGGTFKGELSAATGTFSGNLSAAGGTFKGSLSAATGTFAGELSAATGTFSGTVYCDCLTVRNNAKIGNTLLGDNCVDTAQINGGAVGSSQLAGSSVTSSKINSKAVSKDKTSDGVQTSLDNGDAAHAAVSSLSSGTVTCNSLSTTQLYVRRNSTQKQAVWMNTTISGTTIYYLGSNS